jgi:hypothetical protein
MVQISGAVVLVAATFTLIHVLLTIFRVRKGLEPTLLGTDRTKHQQ